MRYILIACLLAGCSAGGSLTMPGKSPREATVTALREMIQSNPSIPSAYGSCIVDYMNRNLSDDEMRRIDAARATGGQDAAYQTMVPVAVQSCVK